MGLRRVDEFKIIMVYEDYCKRVIDFLLALLALFLICPLIIVVGILVYVSLGSPVLFRQVRPGVNGKPFTIYKFRTMIQSHGENGLILPDSERMTILGRVLRKTSIDELPELFNVLKGDISILGPRPLLMRYLDRYTTEQARRHQVKPGLTGWAQVNGRNAISWEEKFKLDVWYVDNWSVWLDVKIIALTVLNVLKHKGINQPGQATMEEFNPQITQITQNRKML